MDETTVVGADTPVDGEKLREEVSKKYGAVAVDPHGDYHFHTGRELAARLGYDSEIVDGLPDAAVESFAGVASPFALLDAVANKISSAQVCLRVRVALLRKGLHF